MLGRGADATHRGLLSLCRGYQVKAGGLGLAFTWEAAAKGIMPADQPAHNLPLGLL
jgi:hypothetical protein